MSPELEKRIADIAADGESGASEILTRVIAILRDGLAGGDDLPAVSDALRRAQPSMAPVWNAANAAAAGSLERFAQRVARAPQAIARFAVDLLVTGTRPDERLRIVTISYSGTVVQVVKGLATRRPVQVLCSESRPALEGRRLSKELAAAGIPVTCFSDAALGHALEGSAAVLVGADAVTPTYIVNKCGTRMLAADAAHRGIPVYVMAGREKFVGSSVAGELDLKRGEPSAIWADPPLGVGVENLFFERIPLTLISAVVSDAGVIGSDDVVEVCDDMSL